MINPIKPRKCKSCLELFIPVRHLQSVCGAECAFLHAKVLSDKNNALKLVKSRQETKEKLEKFKTRQDWLKEAQQWVNRYVRLRDRNLGCVSCSKPMSWIGQWHASHYRSTKAASAVRFNLWNIHKSCSVCNKWLSGNLGEYEPRIRAKIGDDKVDWLRAQNQTVTYDIEYLKRLKGIFKKKCARLEKSYQY